MLDAGNCITQGFAFLFFVGLALSVNTEFWAWIWGGLATSCGIAFGFRMEAGRRKKSWKGDSS